MKWTNIKKKMKVILPAVALLVASTFTITGASAAKNEVKFKDVPKSHWAYESVLDMTNKGIVSGYPDGTFKPNNSVTRGQTAIFIGRALKLDTKGAKNPGFSDVNSKTSGADYIFSLTNQGVFSKSKKFNPNSPLTRAQMSKVIVEAFDIKVVKGKTFKDVPKNHWAADYISTMAATGITSGKTKTTFDPNSPVTRVQMVAFIDRTLDYIAEQEKKNPVTPKPKPEIPVNPNPEVPVKPKPEVPVDPNPEVPVDPNPEVPSTPIEYLTAEPTFVNGFLQAVNEERATKGLSAFTIDENTSYAANFKAKDMARYDQMEHESPQIGHYDRTLSQFNVNFKRSGEVLTTFYNSGVHESNVAISIFSFFDSQPHYELLMSSRFSKVGIGYQYSSTSEQYYISVMLID